MLHEGDHAPSDAKRQRRGAPAGWRRRDDLGYQQRSASGCNRPTARGRVLAPVGPRPSTQGPQAPDDSSINHAEKDDQDYGRDHRRSPWPRVKLSYVDTSAAMKLVVADEESAALAELLSADRRLIASWLLHTEMYCAAGRHADDVDIAAVREVLDTLNLVDLTRGDMIAAGTHSPLRTNDAIHLAVAIRLGVDEIVTYDSELADAAKTAGLVVTAPGR